MSSLSFGDEHRRSRVVAFAFSSFLFIVLLSTILARTDTKIVSIFNVFSGRASVSSVAAEQQFLLEAVLPNTIGSLIASLLTNNHAVVISWILIGYVLLGLSLLLLIRDQSIDLRTVFLTIVFSYALKTLLSWIGKSDTYLLAFLLPAALSRYRLTRAVASGCAALCHPQITIMALAFMQSTRCAVRSNVQVSSLIGAAIGFIVDNAVVHLVVADGIEGRSDYIAHHIKDMIFGGLFDAAGLLTVTLAPPLLLFALVGVIRPSSIRDVVKASYLPFFLSLAAIFVVSCFLTFDRSRVFVLATLPGYVFLLHRYRQEIYAYLDGRTLVGSLIALLMLAVPQSDFTGWRGSSSVAKMVTRRLAPDVATRRFVCAPGCDPAAQVSP